MKRILLALILSWIAYVRTEGFTSDKIFAPFPIEEKGVVSEEILNILSQPFRYLSKGRQCFVFVSDDGKYVLKFFNKNYFQLPWYACYSYEKERAKRDKRRHFFEKSYEIAYHEFGEEIVCLHLAPTENILKKNIEGPAHQSFSVDLNTVPFIIQRRGQPIYDGFMSVYEKEGSRGLCREIDAYLEQIRLRIEKQIGDADVDIEHNWGYVDGKIFHLDPGRLYRDPTLISSKRQKEEWHIATHRLFRWLKKMHYDEALEYLENQLAAN